ncbi:DMT family transporter [Variovorax terrae]|uniref:DMT family transporter n=1 Tax=Variovorax terrae TaxID=2923278 RepID=A0A9X1VXZ3_9BURK|nr:DMT family transporter [Variovorax terrae]MCJ0764102.1 DMT family transporter [Variovorax terrae]
MQALWMLLASLFFATMGVCIKYASAHFNAFEMVCYRGLIGLGFMAWYARLRGISVRTPIPMMHFWRSIVGVLALVAWFYSIAQLPLATAMTLNYMSSVWIAAFLVGGALMLGNMTSTLVRQGPVVLTVLAGFGGVVLILQPTLEQNQLFAGLIGLLSGLASAFAYMQVTALGRAGEPEERTVFYFSLGATMAGALGMLFAGASAWTWPAALWLLPIGVLAALGQLCMTRAYSHGATLVVANLQYSGIVFASIYSLVLFGDRLPLAGWAGIGLIIASGIAATVLRERAVPHSPAEDH